MRGLAGAIPNATSGDHLSDQGQADRAVVGDGFPMVSKALFREGDGHGFTDPERLLALDTVLGARVRFVLVGLTLAAGAEQPSARDSAPDDCLACVLPITFQSAGGIR
jgi:hypothetical protein